MYAAKSGEHASWLRYEDLLEARRRKAGGMAVDERDGDRMEPGSDNLDAVL
jgi:hypothetical protein